MESRQSSRWVLQQLLFSKRRKRFHVYRHCLLLKDDLILIAKVLWLTTGRHLVCENLNIKFTVRVNSRSFSHLPNVFSREIYFQVKFHPLNNGTNA